MTDYVQDTSRCVSNWRCGTRFTWFRWYSAPTGPTSVCPCPTVFTWWTVSPGSPTMTSPPWSLTASVPLRQPSLWCCPAWWGCWTWRRVWMCSTGSKVFISAGASFVINQWQSISFFLLNHHHWVCCCFPKSFRRYKILISGWLQAWCMGISWQLVVSVPSDGRTV